MEEFKVKGLTISEADKDGDIRFEVEDNSRFPDINSAATTIPRDNQQRLVEFLENQVRPKPIPGITDEVLESHGFGVSSSHKDFSQWSDKQCSVILSRKGGTIVQFGLVTGRDKSLNMPEVMFFKCEIHHSHELDILINRIQNEGTQ